MSLTTLLVILLVLALLGGLATPPWGSPNHPPGQWPPFYSGYGFGPPAGVIIVVLIIVLLVL